MKKCRNILIGTLIIVVGIMAVAYSSLATQFTLNGTAEIVSDWNVKITGIQALYVSENCEAGDMQYTDTTVSFHATLTQPGDYITYLITIQNAGTFNVNLNNIVFTPDENGSTAIIFTNTEPKPNLTAGEETSFMVKVAYDENATQAPEVKTKTITGTIEYVQE